MMDPRQMMRRQSCNFCLMRRVRSEDQFSIEVRGGCPVLSTKSGSKRLDRLETSN